MAGRRRAERLAAAPSAPSYAQEWHWRGVRLAGGAHHGAVQHSRTSVRIDSLSQTIDRALAAAALNAKAGVLKSVSETVEKVLVSAGLVKPGGPTPDGTSPPLPPVRPDSAAPCSAATASGEGQFLSLSYANAQARRDYKLYIPSSHGGEPAPLVVMLHGCQQHPDDFAAGTRMNELAEREGFLVAYPAQAARDNGANCWNWFDARQQRREGIEPAWLAGLVRDIGKTQAVDRSRVFVAGLSAGASMAVILGITYPDVFAGVAAHSGLPMGAAHDVMSAFSAMQGTVDSPGSGALGLAVPTIVFYGDADPTVVPSNGAGVVDQALQGFAESDLPLKKRERSSGALGDKTFTTTGYADASGINRVEEWVVHGGAHAWFGGSAEGSYTDSSGPDASAEIVRFFFSQKSVG